MPRQHAICNVCDSAALTLYPLLPAYVVREGANITLQVETVSFMPQGSEVVQWSSDNDVVASGRELVVESAEVEDGGVYLVNFTKMIDNHYLSAVTSVSLSIQGWKEGCGLAGRGVAGEEGVWLILALAE